MNKRDWQADMNLLRKVPHSFADLENIVYNIAPYWMHEAEKWRTEAFRQHPTQDAYDAVCAALNKHRERADKLEEQVDIKDELLERACERADKAEQELEQVRQSTRFWYIQLKNKEHQQTEELLTEHIIEVESREQKLKEALKHCISQYPQWDSKEIAGTLMIQYMENVLSILYPKEESK